MSLGDGLGRLAAPPTAAPFEAARLAVVDHLLEWRARAPVPHAVWIEALELGAHRVVDQIILIGGVAIRAAVARSRYPDAQLAALLPGPAYRERLYHRLLSTGMALESLEGNDLDPQRQRTRGVALESAWDEVLVMANEELAMWRGRSLELQEWRRPTRRLWIGSAIGTALAILLAGWLGGIFPAPGWFEPIGGLFWGVFLT